MNTPSDSEIEKQRAEMDKIIDEKRRKDERIKIVKQGKKCENCIFYEKDEDEKGKGHCYDIFDEENQGEIVEGSYYVCGSFVDINDVERRSKIQGIDILKEIERVKEQFRVK